MSLSLRVTGVVSSLPLAAVRSSLVRVSRRVPRQHLDSIPPHERMGGWTPRADARGQDVVAIVRMRGTEADDTEDADMRNTSPATGAVTAGPEALLPSHLNPRGGRGLLANWRGVPLSWFRVLFDSLFKVLFTFPSQYLCTIGLGRVFSLGRCLPPTFALHSQATLLDRHARGGADGARVCPRPRPRTDRDGADTLHGAAF